MAVEVHVRGNVNSIHLTLRCVGTTVKSHITLNAHVPIDVIIRGGIEFPIPLSVVLITSTGQ